MRKSFFTCQLPMIALLFLFACGKNDYTSYCPTWNGFTYTIGCYPNYTQGNPRNIILHPGDSLHLTAHQKDLGHLINATYYSWTICYDTLDADGNKQHATKVYNQHTNYDGYVSGYSHGYTIGAADPLCHMLLPENMEPTDYGKLDTIKFVARYSYSGQGVTIDNGSIVDNTSYSGRITPQSGPTGGGAAGYFYFSVVK